MSKKKLFADIDLEMLKGDNKISEPGENNEVKIENPRKISINLKDLSCEKTPNE